MADDHCNDDGYNETNDSHPALDLILRLGRVLDDVGIAILSRVFLDKRDSLVAPLSDRLKPRAGVLEERLKCKTEDLVLNEELGHGSASSDSTWDHQNWRFSNAKTIMNQQRADETQARNDLTKMEMAELRPIRIPLPMKAGSPMLVL